MTYLMHPNRNKSFQRTTNTGIFISDPRAGFSNLRHTSPHLPAFQ